MNHIDWETISKELNASSRSSTYLVCEAIELLIGHNNIRASVDYYIDNYGDEGTELARGVLWHLHSNVAAKYCYEIFKYSSDVEKRTSAVELIRVLVDARKNNDVISWIPEFLNDSEPSIQNWGIGVMDQLVYSELIDDDIAIKMLTECISHPSEQIRTQARSILNKLTKKQDNSDD